MANPKLFYDNRLDDGTPAASTTAAGDYNVLNLRDWRSYTWWKPTALPATITVDCGSAVSADYWAVWGHDLFTQGATIEIRASTDNFSASDVLIDSLTPTSDDPFVREFSSASYRYWRFRITGTTMPSLAICAVGQVLTMPRSMPYGSFDPLGRKIMGRINKSQKGHPLGRSIQYQEFKQRVTIPGVLLTWLRSIWEPAWDAHLDSSPFIFSWEHDNHADEIRLVNIEGEFKTTEDNATYGSLTFQVAGVV